MKLKSYKADLLEQLKDPEFAAAYLAEVLESGDNAAFLIALRDVVEAGGGVSSLAQQARLQRQSLYKALSKRGKAVQMSVFVVRAFLKMRTMFGKDQDLDRKLAALEEELRGRLNIHESAIVGVLQRIMKILDPSPPPPEPPRPQIGFHATIMRRDVLLR